MTKDLSLTMKINRLRSENKKLRAELKNLKEAFSDVLTHNAKLCEQLDECRKTGEKLLEWFGGLMVEEEEDE